MDAQAKLQGRHVAPFIPWGVVGCSGTAVCRGARYVALKLLGTDRSVYSTINLSHSLNSGGCPV